GRSGRQPNFRDAITFFNEQTVTVSGADVPGIIVGGTGNPNLRPERSSEVEFGFDAGFLAQHIGLEVTHYHKRTDDLLVAVPLAPSLGLTATQFQNLGAVLNTGWEYVANVKVLDARKVQFDFSVNASTNNNKLLTLGLLPTGKPVPPIVVNSDQQHRVGYALGSYWLKPISFKDANGDGIIARSEITVGDTAVYLGNIFPTKNYSITPNLTLFNWMRFSALIDHKGGFKLFNNTARFRCAFGNCQAAYDKSTPLADQAASIAATSLGTDAGYVEDATFTKLRELSVTFIASQRVARAFHASGLDLTIAGRNLHTWTNYKGFDPEVNSTANANFSTSDFLTLPPSRTWTARINVFFFYDGPLTETTHEDRNSLAWNHGSAGPIRGSSRRDHALRLRYAEDPAGNRSGRGTTGCVHECVVAAGTVRRCRRLVRARVRRANRRLGAGSNVRHAVGRIHQYRNVSDAYRDRSAGANDHQHESGTVVPDAQPGARRCGTCGERLQDAGENQGR